MASTGEIVRDARKRKGWSKQELADKLGLTRQTIELWEKGETHPHGVRMREVARLLDLLPQELIP